MLTEWGILAAIVSIGFWSIIGYLIWKRKLREEAEY